MVKPSLNISKGDDCVQAYWSGEDSCGGGGGSEGEDGSGSEEEQDCPLCLEEMDESDCHFIPCPCGYQICRFCWHKIREEGNEKCPACRRVYTDADVVFTPTLSPSPEKKRSPGKGSKKQATPAKPTKKPISKPQVKKTLSEYRVIQRNLVYVIGISARIAHENILRESEYFGQYGRILKIVVNRRNLSNAASAQTTTGSNGGATSATSTGPSASAYITFVRKEDAARAIAGVDGSVFDGRVLRATYGTTKYCSFFLRGMACTNAGCMYLHEEGEHIDSFTKDELAAGKLHLHSYVLEKTEAAGMKQFGIIQRSAPVVPLASKPATPSPPPVAAPVVPVAVAFADRTPSSFFARIRDLAAVEDPLALPTEPVLDRPQSPPMVLLPRRPMMGRFDPFQETAPVESLLAPAVTRPPPPPPIGSPLSHKLSPSSNVLRFSESLPDVVQIPAPRPAPPMSGGTVEPAVEQFFNLFCNGALSNNPTTDVASQSSCLAGVHPQQPSQLLSDAAQVPLQHPHQTDHQEKRNSRAEDRVSFALDPAGVSIFEDPAIKRAAARNNTIPTPAVVPQVLRPSSPAVVNPIPVSTPVSTPKSKPSAKKQKAVKAAPIVIQEPVFTNKNAFSALSPKIEASPAEATKTGNKRTTQTLAPVTRTTRPSNPPPPPQSVTRVGIRYERQPIPAHQPQPVPAVNLAAMDLPALEAHVACLQTAIRANQEQHRRIESFMRDIMAKAFISTTDSASTVTATR